MRNTIYNILFNTCFLIESIIASGLLLVEECCCSQILVINLIIVVSRFHLLDYVYENALIVLDGIVKDM